MLEAAAAAVNESDIRVPYGQIYEYIRYVNEPVIVYGMVQHKALTPSVRASDADLRYFHDPNESRLVTMDTLTA